MWRFDRIYYNIFLIQINLHLKMEDKLMSWEKEIWNLSKTARFNILLALLFAIIFGILLGVGISS